MLDTYFMNKKTGEIIPSQQAFHLFYTVQKHDIKDSIFDEWEDTNLEVENSTFKNPIDAILSSVK